MQIKFYRSSILFIAGLLAVTGLNAALFEDDDARKAILDLRQRVEFLRVDAEQAKKALSDENATLTRSLLELQRQLELLRSELAAMRGLSEKQAKDLAELQRQQTERLSVLVERIGRLEPTKVSIDGVDFLADPVERRDFELALGVFKKGEFSAAQVLFNGFIGRYPGSAYVTPALFWLGNAQYATRDYKEAITNFRALIAKSPDHLRAPEAVLSVANCQLELKDTKGARKTLSDLIRAYPETEAASAAKERLTLLK
jgi:tol-pal system protein YbgF